ncbi:M20/M25/M40 family metallo-hydrolase [Ruminococcaceae bacterium OttesenSCG-928-A11]|nr:M20/M25/M40 family metallo-hydrolase [Ruminococcaceae bacterium OttesenSCG-928-A11]
MNKQVVDTARKLYPEIMDTVEFLSTTDRGTKDLPGLAKTAAYLTEQLKALGCEITTHPDEEYGATLVGRKKGTGKTRVLLYAHMDTVWPAGTCAERPYHIEGDFAYGPGVSDCTHGIIAALYSLKILNTLGIDNYGELIILFNPDEELTSPSSTEWLQHYARQVDVAISLEGPETKGTYTTSRDGSVYYNINVAGKKAHAGVEPEKGANALAELTYKLHDILQNPIEGTYLCICWIKGGSGDCIVADNAWSMLRFKISDPNKKAEIDRLLERVNQTTHVPGTTTTIEFWPEGGFLPMPRLPWMDGLCKLVEQIGDELDYPLKEENSGGGADGASTAMIVPTLDGFGPLTYGCHTADERLDLTDIVPRISLLTLLLWHIGPDSSPYIK